MSIAAEEGGPALFCTCGSGADPRWQMPVTVLGTGACCKCAIVSALMEQLLGYGSSSESEEAPASPPSKRARTHKPGTAQLAAAQGKDEASDRPPAALPSAAEALGLAVGGEAGGCCLGSALWLGAPSAFLKHPAVSPRRSDMLVIMWCRAGGQRAGSSGRPAPGPGAELCPCGGQLPHPRVHIRQVPWGALIVSAGHPAVPVQPQPTCKGAG